MKNFLGICVRLKHVVLILLVFVTYCCCDDRQEVSFYEDPFYEGDRLILTLGNGCYNFDKDWDNRASSADTQGICLIAYEYADCKGPSVKLSPGVRGQGDLRKLAFNNAISSVSVCSRFADDNDNKLSGDSAEIAKVGLDEHNKYRRMHGVPDLKGHSELHKVAQRHADYLAKNNRFEASTDNEFGENVATSFKKNRLDAIRDVVKRWYDKIEYYNFEKPDSNKDRPRSGQFSSIVWKSTTHLGVGVAWNQKDRKWVVVANYDPPSRKSQYRENVPPLIRQIEFEEPSILKTIGYNQYDGF